MIKELDYTWEDIEKALIDAATASCKPDQSKFPKPEKNEIIDEEKSVRWNREEKERLWVAYDEEKKRLRHANLDKVREAQEKGIGLIAYEVGISREQAKIVWDFVETRYHDDIRTMIREMEEHTAFVYELLQAGKSDEKGAKR